MKITVKKTLYKEIDTPEGLSDEEIKEYVEKNINKLSGWSETDYCGHRHFEISEYFTNLTIADFYM